MTLLHYHNRCCYSIIDNMPRGGYRPGAGGKPKWIRGKTTVIRVPEVLADEVLRVARLLDEGKMVDDVTRTKYLNLAGVSLRLINGRPAVFVEDLVNAGFKVRPLEVLDKVMRQIDKRGV